MPGGRLTDQDRKHIASGLARGLGYAEVARRLGRPTSTISREVARNGGPDGYRADDAHRTARRRARRRAASRPSELPATVDAYGRDPEVVGRYVERFASVMVQTGMPRMAARVFACLISTDAGVLTAAELVRQLRVSPASVSKAIGYLEGLDLVIRDRDPGRRRERYVIDDDTWLRTWLTSARTNAVLAETARHGAEIFDAATPAGTRLDQMARFFTQLSDDMAGGPAAFDDLMTVAAALVHAGRAISVEQLATGLDWPTDRVISALHDAERHPDVIDPVAVQLVEPGCYSIEARSDRLTAIQQAALST